MAVAKIWKRKAQHFTNGRSWKPTVLASAPNVLSETDLNGPFEYGSCLTHDEGQSQRWTKSRKAKLAEELESILLAFDCSSYDKSKHLLDRFACKLPPSYYKDAVLFGTEIDCLYSGISFSNAKPQDFGGEFDVSMCTTGKDDSKWQLFRMRNVPMKWARGFRLKSPFVAELATTWINADGNYDSQTMLVNWCSDNSWHTVEANSKENVNAWKQTLIHQETTLSNVCKSLLGLQFSKEMIWQVVFQFSAISISVFCDMEAAGAAFKDRDVETGMTRRAALRHWVNGHMRRVSSEDEKLTEVVRHLRGRIPFRWRGIDCELIVPNSDIKLCEKLKAERDARSQSVK